MEPQAYNLWLLVIINSAVFIIFAFSFTKPKTSLDWRSFGAYSAFIIALFTEMYGFPLTIYLLSGYLSTRFPSLDLFSHNAGHLWETFLGWKGDPHLDPIHILSYIFIGFGFFILSSAWDVLYKAQKQNRLANNGIYAKIRHPQYVGFITIMIGFLLQWPTLVTLIMFPILVTMYDKLAKSEEKSMVKKFGKKYLNYAKRTPAFFPSINKYTLKTGS